ncbi:MAG TPA: hypothetical protein VF268_11435, partial [Gammaproteobacteria bacterium]
RGWSARKLAKGLNKGLKQGRNWKLIRMKVAIEIYAVKKPNKSEVPKVNKSWRRGILLLKQT